MSDHREHACARCGLLLHHETDCRGLPQTVEDTLRAEIAKLREQVRAEREQREICFFRLEACASIDRIANRLRASEGS